MSPDEYDSLIDNLRKLPGEFKALVEKRIELFTLEVGERISSLFAHAIYRIMGIVFIALGLILVLFAAANFVGNMLQSDSLGFLIVATPILVLGLLFFFRRPRSMVIAFRNKMLQQFLQDLTDQMSEFENDSDEGDPNPDQKEPDNQNSRESQKPNH